MKITEMYLRLKYQDHLIEILTLEEFEKEAFEVCFESDINSRYKLNELVADCEDMYLVQISPFKTQDSDEDESTYAIVYKNNSEYREVEVVESSLDPVFN